MLTNSDPKKCPQDRARVLIEEEAEFKEHPKYHTSFPNKSDIAMDFLISVLINRQ
jgi:hypothetical protein